jgi:uncharacterized membrane protein YvlD (DUF360 family)
MTLAFLTAFAVMAMRIVLHLLGTTPEGMDFMLIHFLAIVTIVFFTGERLMRSHNPTGFPDLMREGFRNAAIYALLLGLFTWLFFTTIDTGHFKIRVDDMVSRGMAEGQPEAIIRPRLEQFFTPFNYATITFFALMVVSAILSFVLGLLHHKVLRPFRR